MGRGRRRPERHWHRRDWLLAQALTEYERLLCSGCGHPLYETLADERTADYHYEAPPPQQCLACAEVARRTEPYKGQEIPGFKFPVEKRPGNILDALF